MKHWNDRPTDALDARIDAGLRRGFAPPDELEFRAPTPEGGAPRFAPWMLAAGLACALGLFAWRSSPGGVVDEAADVAFLPPSVGGPERPDLANLYDAVFGFPQPVVGCDVEAGVLSDGVESSLASRCGASIDLAPDAASLLVGPFSSQEWPSGTVLAGYPDGPDQPPVVIVAECADYQDCCIDLGAASALGLQHFSAEFGGVALTEITPHAEPRLLGLLAANR